MEQYYKAYDKRYQQIHARNLEWSPQNPERIHGETGQQVQVAETSCRMVSFETLEKELKRNGLKVTEKGITEIPEHFPMIMYAVAEKA